MKIRLAAIFSLCVLVFFIVFVYQAQEWRLQARLYPLGIGIPMVVLALIQVILDLTGYKPTERNDSAPVDFQFSQDIEPHVARRRALTMFAWLFGFFLLIWLFGFMVGIPLMVFSYLKFQSGESWFLSTLLTVIAFVFFYGLFVEALTLPFPEGKIFIWLGLS